MIEEVLPESAFLGNKKGNEIIITPLNELETCLLYFSLDAFIKAAPDGDFAGELSSTLIKTTQEKLRKIANASPKGKKLLNMLLEVAV